MTDTAWHTYTQRLSFEDRWSVDAIALNGPMLPADHARLIERNLAALTTLAALEDRRVESSDEDTPVLQELARLDAKLNALVELVNRLLVPAHRLPARQSVSFNAIGALLPAALVPAEGAVLLRLHFDACPSVPLELPGSVQRQGDDGRAFVVFADLGEGLSEAIERLVFRHHRRKVAESRQLSP